jgi:hypothetical protein
MRINCTFSTLSHAQSVLEDLQGVLSGIDRLDLRDTPMPQWSGLVQMPGEPIVRRAGTGGASVNFYCPDQCADEAIRHLKAAGARKINLRA